MSDIRVPHGAPFQARSMDASRRAILDCLVPRAKVPCCFPCLPMPSHALKDLKSRWVTCLIQTARLRRMFHRCQHLISPRKKALKVLTSCTKLSGILEQLCCSLGWPETSMEVRRHCKSFLKVLRFGACMCCQFPGISKIPVSVFITFHI